ncbi:MAG: glycosyltransferase family A protein [Sphingopyxis sp.]
MLLETISEVGEDRQNDLVIPSVLQRNAISGLVSVIVPTYNRARLLPDLLASLAAQTWKPLEIIIVDDGSTDDTQPYLARWAESHDALAVVRLERTNGGPAAARNLGLRHASGEYVYFIDSDDIVFPTGIAQMVAALRASGRPYCLAPVDNADINGELLPLNFDGVPRWNPQTITASNWMTHGALYRRSAIIAAGAFNETLRVGEDSEFQWRVVATNPQCHILPESVGLRRIHGHGHLSAGRGEREKYHDITDAFQRFVEWGAARGVITRKISRSILRANLVIAVNLGCYGDWRGLEACQDLARSLAPYSSFGAPTLVFATRPRLSAYYAVVRLAVNSARAARDRVRIGFRAFSSRHRQFRP